MENSKKQLKSWSILALILAGFSFANLLIQLCFVKFDKALFPTGSTEGLVFVAKIVIVVLAFLLLLPQLYIGIKGLKVAKNPDNSGAHIVWATILLVIAVLGMISPIGSLVKQEAIRANISELCSLVIEAVVFFEYIIMAKAVRNGK